MTRKIIIIAAAILVFAAAFVLKEARNGNGTEASGHSRAGEAEAMPRLLELGSTKCIPCKKMAPILEALSEEYRGSLVVEFIDVWEDPEAGKPYGIRIIPTQIFFDASGEERFRHEGFIAKEAILDKWRELGVDLGRRAAAEAF